jgi:aspartate kinase
MTAILESQGVLSKYLALDKLVTKKFDEKTIDQSFYDYLTMELRPLVKERQGKVIVATGFMGPIPGSVLSTIGRGYTDLTAALIAVASSASELQIWKEVDGIFTGDPRKVPKAKLLSHISPEETAEITYYGSEVVHPFTMEQVIRARIPIRIKNTFSPQGRGSVIIPEGYLSATRTDTATATSSKHPTAVTIKEGVMVLNILSNRKSVSHGFFENIFTTLNAHGIVVDLISTSQVQISMALGPNVHPERLETAIQDLKRFGRVDVISNLAILSLVGREMRNMVGIASKMFSSLANHSVNIEMISQGDFFGTSSLHRNLLSKDT